MNIAVFASGRGTNFQAIINNIKSGYIKANLSLLVCDNPKAYCLDRAKKGGVPILLVERKDFTSKAAYEARIMEELKNKNIGLIALAGYMRIVGPDLVKKYRGRMMNLHPALLPSFKGTEGIKDAFEYGVKITGPTVHFVDEEMDHGPIILQAPVLIEGDDTEETLAEKIHQQEHKIYPEAIRLFAEGKLKIGGRRVRILS